MAEQVKYALPAHDISLIIGDCEAENTITMISNPYCQPCTNAHKALDGWIANRNDVKLQVIFLTGKNENDRKAKIAAHLFSLQATKTNAYLKNALNEWYDQEQKDYETWAKKHPTEGDWSAKSALKQQREWCKLTETHGTPVIFLNGRKLPKIYSPEDLKYLI